MIVLENVFLLEVPPIFAKLGSLCPPFANAHPPQRHKCRLRWTSGLPALTQQAPSPKRGGRFFYSKNMIICYNQTEKQKVIWGVGADESALFPVDL